MLQVQGRSDLFLGLEIIKKIIGIGPLMAGIFIGVIPMLFVSVIVNIIYYFLNSYYTGKLLGYSSWMQIRDVAPSYGIASIVALSVYFLKYLPFSNWAILPLQVILGFICFLTICRLTKNNEFLEIKNIATPAINKIRKK